MAGDYAEVHYLMGPGVDPHLYRPTHQDIQWLSKADIIITNGLKLEGKLSEILSQMKGRRVWQVGAALPADSLERIAENEFDAHIWLDPLLWKTGFSAVFDSLSRLMTKNTAEIQEKAAFYLNGLSETHDSIKRMWAGIDNSRRILVTAHDAFGYYGRRYGIEVKALQGTSTVAEFGLRDINDLVDFIVKNQIKAIFTENIVSPKAIEAVLEGCRKRGHAVELGATLYTDALGEAGGPAATYTGLMLENTRLIISALANE